MKFVTLVLTQKKESGIRRPPFSSDLFVSSPQRTITSSMPFRPGDTPSDLTSKKALFVGKGSFFFFFRLVSSETLGFPLADVRIRIRISDGTGTCCLSP